MKQVYVAIRTQQGHKRVAIMEGVEELGYKHVNHPSALEDSVESLIVTWNLHGLPPRLSRTHAHVPTIVVENPYVKYDPDGNEYLAVGLYGHNGSGRLITQRDDRLSRLGLEMKPWRGDDGWVLVIGQRGIGSTEMRSPPGWGERIEEELRAKYGHHREIRLRPHPGNNNVNRVCPLEQDLDGAFCVVMWASNVATEALLRGIPVFYDAPYCVLSKACQKGVDDLDSPFRGDRVPAFNDLAWAQWSLGEIRSGECFRTFLEYA